MINLNEFSEEIIITNLRKKVCRYHELVLEYEDESYRGDVHQYYDNNNYYEELKKHMEEFHSIEHDYTKYKAEYYLAHGQYIDVSKPTNNAEYFERWYVICIAKVLFDLAIIYIEDGYEGLDKALEETGISSDQFMFYYNQVYSQDMLDNKKEYLNLFNTKKEGFDFEWWLSAINSKDTSSVFDNVGYTIIYNINKCLNLGQEEAEFAIENALDRLEVMRTVISVNRYYIQLLLAKLFYGRAIVISTDIFYNVIANYIFTEGNTELYGIPESDILELLERGCSENPLRAEHKSRENPLRAEHKSRIKYILDLKKYGYDNLQRATVDDDDEITDKSLYIISSYWNK